MGMGFLLLTILLLLLGLLLLYFGAEWLVKGSAGLALKSGVSALAVGLTVVAFGTSAPEMVVSVDASLRGSGDIAVGNVVGSNIFNIAVILGFSALFCPLTVNPKLFRLDLPVLIASSLLISLFLVWNRLCRWEGLLLLVSIFAYTFWHIYAAKKHKIAEPEAVNQISEGASRSYPYYVVFVVAGLLTLILGARLLVDSSVQIARSLEISEAVIALTIIAAGTSLPELATSLIAAIRKQSDIAIGNIVGSNIFNVLAILGVAASIHPFECQGISRLDLITMNLLSLLLLPFMRSGFTLSRWEGSVFLVIYGVYLYFLWPK